MLTFQEFLKYIREKIGFYCTDIYWLATYIALPNNHKNLNYIESILSNLAINAIATDASKDIVTMFDDGWDRNKFSHQE
jgi:hypothetical protein